MKQNDKHAIERAKQRYDLDLTKEKLRMLYSNISQGHGVKLSTLDGRSVYMVKIDGVVAKCVVSDVLNHIVTFLPKDHMRARKEIYKVRKTKTKHKRQFYTRKQSRKAQRLGRAKQHR